VLELIIKQSGARVSGQINLNSARFDLKDGVIDGNTLRFKVVRAGKPWPNGATLPDEVLGTGELVMDADGKSFKGTILGTATSGTLVEPKKQ